MAGAILIEGSRPIHRFLIFAAAPLALSACVAGGSGNAPPADPSVPPPPHVGPPPAAPAAAPPFTGQTRVLDRAALTRLLGNSGVTLQWIGWDRRGELSVSDRGGTVRLTGGQRGDPGTLAIDGAVTEIGADYFLFDGRIAIIDTPDPGRQCIRNGPMRFAVTQNRKYWRLQAMEACDGLTDYVDIYF